MDGGAGQQDTAVGRKLNQVLVPLPPWVLKAVGLVDDQVVELELLQKLRRAAPNEEGGSGLVASHSSAARLARSLT